jgi:hypothetical protein
MAYVTPQLALVGEAIKTVLGSQGKITTGPFRFEYPDGDETYRETLVVLDESGW